MLDGLDVPGGDRLAVEALEPRVLFSADAALLVAGTDAPAALWASVDDRIPAAADTAGTATALAPAGAQARRELIVVDAAVPDAQGLVDTLTAGTPTRFGIVQLEPGRDAIAQIGEALAAAGRVDAVHVLSHGEPGALVLAGERIDAAALEARADVLRAWAGALSDDADLLLYGCDLAASAEGAALMDRLATLTGADVAASDDPTGAGALGGDWDLEAARGRIDTEALSATDALAMAEKAAWDHLLGTLSVDTANDVVDGDTSSVAALLASRGADGHISLREAVIAANHTQGADTILLQDLKYDIDGLQGVNEDAAASGDLDVVGELTIRGVRDGGTEINGRNRDRVFDVHAGATLVVEDVKIKDGKVDGASGADGAGALVHAGARLVATGVRFEHGDASGDGGGVAILAGGSAAIFETEFESNDAGASGAGIANLGGALEVQRASFHRNDAGVTGGGVFHTGGAGASLVSVTLYDNAAAGGGGAIATQGALSLSQATVAQNTGTGSNGNAFRITAGGSITLRMSIVDNESGGSLSSNAPVISADYNIDRGDDLGLNGAHDRDETDPKLGSFGDHGGATRTIALDSDSPAINAGSTSGTTRTDQRGVDRTTFLVVLRQPDIGAYEYDSTPSSDLAARADAGGAYAISEGDALTLDASASTDPDSGASDRRYLWDLDGDGAFDDASGANPTLSWAQLQALGIADDGHHTIRLRVESTVLGAGMGNPVEAVASLDVANVRPTLAVAGATSANQGSVYSLALSASDPGADTISQWVVNWGDGQVDRIAVAPGNPATVATHTYTAGGFTRDITVAAIDEDGTWFDSALALGLADLDRVDLFAPVTGAPDGTVGGATQPQYPRHAAYGPDGRLYVADWGGDRVLVRNPGSGEFEVFVAAGSGGLTEPVGPAFGPDGHLYVTSYDGAGHDAVLRFDGTTGAYLGVVVPAGDRGAGDLAAPVFGADGLLYAGDQTGGVIRRYDVSGPAGVWVDDFVTSGVADLGRLTWGAGGDLFVSLPSQHRVDRFNGVTGQWWGTFTDTVNDDLDTPWGIAFGPDGHLYVASTGNDSVERYDGQTGAYLGKYVGDGWGGSAGPSSLAFAPALQVAVVPSNTAPVLSAIEGSTLAFVEGTGSLPVTASLAVSDADSPTLASATVAIASGYVNGEDVLEFVDTGTITGSWSAATGVLTLTGVDIVAMYEFALRNVSFRNTSESPTAGARAIAFTVTDTSALASNTAIRFVDVQPLDDAPVLSAIEGAALGWTEGDAPAPVSASLAVADADSAVLTGATVRVSAGYTAGEDVLGFVDTASIAGSWSAATGTLTLTGSDSLANWQAALRSVTYENASDAPAAVYREVEFVVSDGTIASAPVARAIDVAAVNDAPALAGVESTDLAYTEGDGNVPLSAGITATDADSPTLASATLRITAGHVPGEDSLALPGSIPAGVVGTWIQGTGTLTLSGPATLAEYTTMLRGVVYRNLGENPAAGARTVTITLNDGVTDSAPVTRQVVVAPANDPPVLSAIEAGVLAITEGDAAVPLTATLTVADVDSATLAGAVVSFGAGYRAGEDVLRFSDTLTIASVWNPGAGTLTLAGVDTVAAYEAALRAVRYENASQNPAATRTVAFVVDDGVATSAPVARTVDVAPVNQAPVLTLPAGTLGWTEGAAPEPLAAGATLADVDSTAWDGGVLQVSIDAGAAPGDRLAIVPAGNGPGQVDVLGNRVRYGGTEIGTVAGGASGAPLTVTFDAGAVRDMVTAVIWRVGFDSTSVTPGVDERHVSFTVSDGDGGTSAPQQATLRVTAVNGAATISAPASIAATEDTDFTFASAGAAAIAIDDADAGTDTLDLTLRATQGTLALARLDGLTVLEGSGSGVDASLRVVGSTASVNAALDGLRYAAPADWSGDAEIHVAFTEVASGRPATVATIAVAVAPVNDAPTLATNAGLSTGETSAIVVTSGMLAIADIDDPSSQRFVTVLGAPAHGRLTLDDTTIAAGGRFSQADIDAGRVRYVPAGDGSLTDGFAFRVSDGAGASGGDFDFRIALVLVDAGSGAGAGSSTAAGTSSTASQTGGATAAATSSNGSNGATAAQGLDAALLASASDGAEAQRRRQLASLDENLLPGATVTTRNAIASPAESARAAAGSGASTGRAGSEAGAVGAAGGATSLLAIATDVIDSASGARGIAAGGIAAPGESRASQGFATTVASAEWRRELDRIRDEVAKDTTLLGAFSGGSAAVVGSLSVGYVFWLLRGGMLLTSLLTAMPAWYAFDPMPVLARRGEGLDDDGGDAVERMFGRAPSGPAPTPTPDRVPPAASGQAADAGSTPS